MRQLSRDEIAGWLRHEDERALSSLWHEADATRRRCVGDAVFLRGLVEFSNHCARRCAYCGIRAGNGELRRYRMSADEILQCAREAVAFGYGTVVLQSGEDYAVTRDWLAGVIGRIKSETPLAVTLSVGERQPDELEAWRRAGADRYLLRFETSNPELFRRIHPPLGRESVDRLALLRLLRELDYEVGSGVMVGIPGQSYDDLARDIELFAELDLDMIGVGPFIPHPSTPLGVAATSCGEADTAAAQVPATELMTYKVVALARLACPHANIPSTSALATLNVARGRELGLQRGANIIMPVLTPVHYRVCYEIYPGKACIQESASQCADCVRRRIEALGRTIGAGPGDSPNWTRRRGLVTTHEGLSASS